MHVKNILHWDMYLLELQNQFTKKADTGRGFSGMLFRNKPISSQKC